MEPSPPNHARVTNRDAKDSRRYASASSGRTKDYVVEAQRVAFAHGGIYLFAWVAEYQQIRTFAAERIETFGLLDDTFEPRAMPLEPFGDSLGVNTGKPEKIVVEFEPDTAVFVREREWHKSQTIDDLAGGRIRVTLDVCNDYALRAWILGFGAGVRVVSPAPLAVGIRKELDAARLHYAAPRAMVKASMRRAG